MNFNEITPVVLAFNEEANLERTLQALRPFPLVLVLDSGSRDRTARIVSSFENTRLYFHPFESFAAQWNHAITLVKTPWILALDADYFLPASFLERLDRLQPDPRAKAYRIPFRYCIEGHPLSQTILPPRITLFQGAHTTVVADGHTQQMEVNGWVGEFNEPVWHDDRKPFSRWFSAQLNYAEQEAEKLGSLPWKELSPQDKLRKLVVFAPWAVLFYCLIIKRLAAAGRAGFVYSGQRFIAEAVLSGKLIAAWLKA